MVLHYLVILASLLGAPPAELTFESTKLPRAVEVVAESFFIEPAGNRPFDRMEARIAETWVEGKQFVLQGSAGYVLYDTTYDTEAESIILNIGRSRGAIGSRMKRTGTSRLDPFLSPIGFLRAARNIDARGTAIPQETSGDNNVYLLQADPLSRVPLRVEVDRASGRIISSTHRAAEDRWVRSVYLDWKQLDGDRWHPRRIEVEYHQPGEPDRVQIFLIKEIRVIDGAVVPPRPTFSSGAVFELEDGKSFVDHAGKSVNPPGSVPSSSTSSWDLVFDPKTMLAAGAITVLAAAALILRQRLAKK